MGGVEDGSISHSFRTLRRLPAPGLRDDLGGADGTPGQARGPLLRDFGEIATDLEPSLGAAALYCHRKLAPRVGCGEGTRVFPRQSAERASPRPKQSTPPLAPRVRPRHERATQFGDAGRL